MRLGMTLSVAAIAVLHGQEILPKVVVTTESITTPIAHIATQNTGDSASLLSMTPGVSLNSGGGLSSLPSIHGLADDRIKMDIDGMQITSACPNHMNPALSYIDTTKIASMEAVAGITPVSQGGDSIAGTIIVKTKEPLFAKKGETLFSGDLTGFYRSNNHARGLATTLTGASDKVSVTYSGFAEKAASYKNGHGDKVKGTLYEQQNQSATLAYKLDSGVVSLKLGTQKVGDEGFPNQYMDMLSNQSVYGNIGYKGQMGLLFVDANAFRQQTHHYMNKITTERTGNMPMYTKAEEQGVKINALYPISSDHTIKFGTELMQYKLNDWWPPVSTTVGGMGNETFINLNNAHRDRLGIYAESDYQWSPKLSTLIGIRTDIVTMKTGDVQGYNHNTGAVTTYNNQVDANAFNRTDRNQRDVNYDVTAMVKYEHNQDWDIDFGFARKSRSPNLYERFAWSGGYGATINGPIAMDMAMINWFGDGGGYVGNVNLKPEVANTLSATFAYHESTQKSWGVKLTPYYTKVQDYIDARYLGKATAGGYTGIRLFQFTNTDAVLFGTDLSGYAKLWDSSTFGEGMFKGVMGYTRGYRTTGGSLYHMMPLHIKASLDQKIGAWTNGVDIQAVDSKTSVDSLRAEPKTAGYALVDLRSRYEMTKDLAIDASITNLFDKAYALPLGGVDVVNYTKTSYTPLQGMGRSFNVALTMKF